MTRFGWTVVLGLCGVALAFGLWLAGVFSAPADLAPAAVTPADPAPTAPAPTTPAPADPAPAAVAQEFRLPTADGKDVLVWSCTGATAESDARAAMTAFETGLAAISTRTAAAMQAAMTAASAKGEAPADLPEIEARGETEARALATAMETQFACRLESF